LRITQTALRLLILILIVYGSAMLWSVSGALTEAQEQLAVQKTMIRTLQEENEEAYLRVQETDEKEKLEIIARQQLGLVGPGETVIYNVGD